MRSRGWASPPTTRASSRAVVPGDALHSPSWAASARGASGASGCSSPSAAFGSRAVYRGDKISRRKLDEIAGRPRLPRPAARRAGTARGRDDEGPRAMKFDVRAYAYRDEVLLLGARVYQGQVTNLRSPGGGFSAICVARAAETRVSESPDGPGLRSRRRHHDARRRCDRECRRRGASASARRRRRVRSIALPRPRARGRHVARCSSCGRSCGARPVRRASRRVSASRRYVIHTRAASCGGAAPLREPDLLRAVATEHRSSSPASTAFARSHLPRSAVERFAIRLIKPRR